MPISNLVIELKPEEVPDFMKGKFFELHYDHSKAIGLTEDTYVGWVFIREDGQIEFGEPGC